MALYSACAVVVAIVVVVVVVCLFVVCTLETLRWVFFGFGLFSVARGIWKTATEFVARARS
jgi:bacteriorhodopsin